MADPNEPPSQSPQVRVQFSTNQPDIALPSNPGPILVPTSEFSPQIRPPPDFNHPFPSKITKTAYGELTALLLCTALRRAGLSAILNHLLSSTLLGQSPVPFDILIANQFLRTDLDAYLTAHGLSQEGTLQLEYLRALPLPRERAGWVGDDWVGAVRVLATQRGQSYAPQILSGSYDGLLRAHDAQGAHRGVSKLLDAPPMHGLKHLEILSSTKIATATLGGGIAIHSVKTKQANSEGGAETTVVFKPTVRLLGNTHPVTALCALGRSAGEREVPASKLISASTSGHVTIWDLHAPPTPYSSSSTANGEDPSSRPTKKRKPAGEAVHLPTLAPQQLSRAAPHLPLTAMTLAASEQQLYATTPSSLETLSLETLRSVSSRPLGAYAACVARLQQGGLLAVGTAGRGVLLVDPRTAGGVGGGRVLVGTLRGHRNLVSCLAAAPQGVGGAGEGAVFASGSLDGTVKVWDLRGGSNGSGNGGVGGGDQSVYTILRRSAVKGARVLGLDWEEEVGIVSGGSDCVVQVDGFGDGVVVENGDEVKA